MKYLRTGLNPSIVAVLSPVLESVVATQLRAANRQLMREINTSLVLSLVRQHGPIARNQIADLAHLSAATVTGITGELIGAGLIFETSTGTSTGGRRPILLSFNSNAGLAVGLKITENRVVYVETDLDGTILYQTEIMLGSRPTPEMVVAEVAREVEATRDRHPQRRLLGVGAGIAGVVDRPSGVCRFSPFLKWRNVPLRSLLEEATGIPAIVENDVSALTHTFIRDPAVGSTGTFLVVTFGRGIGLGMRLNGQLYRGPRGQGGEYGHITVDPSGPVCDCGKHGCLEAIASLAAITRQFAAETGAPATDEAFRDALEDGHPAAVALATRASHLLGTTLATLVNVLTPEAIVFSGEGAWLADLTLDDINATMQEAMFEGLHGSVETTVQKRDDTFWARGAAELLIDDVLTPPLATRTATPMEVA